MFALRIKRRSDAGRSRYSQMRYRLRTLLFLLALVPPLLGYTYYLATGSFARYLPEINSDMVPIAGGSRFSINADGTVDDDP